MSKQKIFISWSGELTHEIAIEFSKWLPIVLPYTEPWMSSQDIADGTLWNKELTENIRTINHGLVCATKESVDSRWVLFEAGGLFKVEGSRLNVVKLGVDNADLAGPLSTVQDTEFDPPGLTKMVHDINKSAGDERIPESTINEYLDKFMEPFHSNVSELVSKIEKQFSEKNSGPDDSAKGSLDQDTEQSKVLDEIVGSVHRQERSMREMQKRLNNIEAPSISGLTGGLTYSNTPGSIILGEPSSSTVFFTNPTDTGLTIQPGSGESFIVQPQSTIGYVSMSPQVEPESDDEEGDSDDDEGTLSGVKKKP